MNPQTLRHLATAQGMEPITDAEFAGESAVPKSAVAGARPRPRRPAGRRAVPAKTEREAKRLAGRAQLHCRRSRRRKFPRRRRPGWASERRLSLDVALETHAGQAIRFRREGGRGELVLGLQDSDVCSHPAMVIVAAAVAGRLDWATCARTTARDRRRAGLAVPIGLSGLVPLAWTPLLDGLLLGALAAGCLWILLRVLAAARMSCSVRGDRSGDWPQPVVRRGREHAAEPRRR